MANPSVMLGGVPVVIQAGSLNQSIDTIGGEGLVRLALGDASKMSHWSKAIGSISSGDGWMPPGLDGIDYSQPLELRLSEPHSITGTSTSVSLTSLVRPDDSPWVMALVGEDWIRAECSYSDGEVTIEPVIGASLYSVYWLPVYTVFATRPPKSIGAGVHGWTINWEEA